MIPYLIWLDSPQQPITDDMLYGLDVDDMIMSCTRTRTRDQTPHLSIEMENPGWEVWETGQQRACALVESEDGTMATARILGRGVVRTLPPAVSGETLTLDVELCLDEDPLAAAKEAAATAILRIPLPSTYDEDGTLVDTDPTAEQLPYLDRLFGRPERYADALPLTRHGFWRYDPVNHAVAWWDHSKRKRVVNLDDAYDIASLQVNTTQGAVREVRCKLVAPFTMQSTGTCDIGSWVGPVTSLTGYSSNAAQSLAANAGWSLGTPTVVTVDGVTEELPTGRVFEYKARPVRQEQRLLANASNGQTETVTIYSAEYTQRLTQYKRLKVKTSYFTSWPANWSWSQSIRETARIKLTVPVQPGAVAVRDYVDLGTIQISDPHSIDGLGSAEPYRDGQTYKKGDTVTVGGKIYRALVDGIDRFWVVTQARGFAVSTTTRTVDTRWIDTGYRPPLASPSAKEFFATPRGLACIAGQLLRMRVTALSRLQSWGVTLTALRSDLPWDLDLDDGVRVVLPGRQGTDEGKACIGRIASIVERWHGDEGETVTLTLAVPVGDGSDRPTAQARVGAYVGDGYVEDDYLQGDTATLDATDDVEWTWDADDLSLPVEPDYLPLPGYSVLGYEKANQLDVQRATFLRLAASGAPPEGVNGLPNTQVSVAMRPLATETVIDREYRVSARLTRSPRGIRLTGPGEP